MLRLQFDDGDVIALAMPEGWESRLGDVCLFDAHGTIYFVEQDVAPFDPVIVLDAKTNRHYEPSADRVIEIVDFVNRERFKLDGRSVLKIVDSSIRARPPHVETV